MQARLSSVAFVFILMGCGGAVSSDPGETSAPSDAAAEVADVAVASEDAAHKDSFAEEVHDAAVAEPHEAGPEPGETGETGPSAEAGQDGGPPPQEVVDFLTLWFETQCSAMAGCCTAAGLSFDAQACADGSLSLVMGLVGPTTTLNTEQIDTCIQALALHYSHCDPIAAHDFDWETEEAIINLCGSVIEGKAQPGEDCATVLDCSAAPEGRTSCHNGHCQWILPAKQGEPCVIHSDAATTNECFMAEGLYCSDESTCKPIGNPGEPCGLYAYPSCYEGMCLSATQTCPAVLGAGDGCGPDGPDCAWNLRCDPATNVCVATRKAGEPCLGDEECLSATCVAGRCSPLHHRMLSGPSTCSPP